MMVRHLGIEREALTYYISTAGKGGKKIFMDDVDRLYFKNLLQKQKIRATLKIYCYVLLPSQYSLLMKSYTSSISRSMHWINSVYANYFNRRHNHKNKLFKDHYSCFLLDEKYSLLELSCHLHTLPSKDGGVKSLSHYEWSSFPGYINRKKREDWVDYDFILNMFKGESHIASLNYKKYITKSLKKQVISPFKELRGRIVLRSEEFKKEVLKNQHLNRIENQRNKDILANKIIKLVTQSLISTSSKIKKKKLNQTILSRNAAIYFLKKYTDLSNQEISNHFKFLKTASISQMSRRFNLTKEKYKAIKEISASLEEKIKNYCN